MKKWKVVIILALAQFVMVLDSTVMNVSISTVVKDLDTTVNAMQGAITFYTLTMAALMLIGAKLCQKWGLKKAFSIGAIVYGIGSLMTGLAVNFGMLFLGWSIIEGLGAVLVIPAIVSLVAANYSGKDRVTAYAIIGGISGAAAAAGPLIGGFMTTYLSWRYVFIAETIIMAIVLLLARGFKDGVKGTGKRIDFMSGFLSALGLTMVVFGMLQSKVWGWVTPITKPEIAGHEIAPFGISICAYLILGGLIVLWLFYNRQVRLEKAKGNPLIRASMLDIKQLRSGLGVLTSQYAITAAAFFVVPVYLQMVLGLDALETGIKIFPLSVALILFSVIGPKLSNNRTPRQIVRLGQVLLIIGSLALLGSIDPSLSKIIFAIAMFTLGAGLGLLASQLSNVNMSAVDTSESSEVGGLQGTFQNLGSSFGTALIGSVLVAALTTGFLTSVSTSSLPESTKSTIQQNVTSLEIVPTAEVAGIAESNGATPQEAQEISDIYAQAQLDGLRKALFFLVIISVLSLVLSRNLPATLMNPKTASKLEPPYFWVVLKSFLGKLLAYANNDTPKFLKSLCLIYNITFLCYLRNYIIITLLVSPQGPFGRQT